MTFEKKLFLGSFLFTTGMFSFLLSAKKSASNVSRPKGEYALLYFNADFYNQNLILFRSLNESVFGNVFRTDVQYFTES